MKKITLSLLALGLFCSASFAKPVLSKNKYLIATLYDGATGTVSPGTSTYPLVYNPERDTESAEESDYWIIKDQGNNQYSFQNASTLKYIKYDSKAANDRTALIMASALQADNSTLFTLELKENNNLCYYVVRSVVNSQKIWDRRGTTYDTYFPVGVFNGSGSSNECFIFYDADGNPAVDDTKTSTVVPAKGVRTLGAFKGYASSLTFDAKAPVVDTANKQFFLSVPKEKMGTTISMVVNFALTNSAYKLYINNTAITSGENYSFSNVSSSKTYSMEIRNGSTAVASGEIIFSCLPLVQLYSETTIGSVYIPAHLAVTEADKTDTTEVINMNIKTRGATAASKPKKAYALKLKEADGETSMDRTYLGLRSDNNWILDAMYIDPGRMRNRISTDLWNEFSTRPYHAGLEPSMVNGTRGGFVEVFLNDSYNGLYCMTEKVDRKQLKLKKLKYSADSTVITQRGGLYKADQWSTGTMLGRTFSGPLSANYNNGSETWNSFEVKYPDLGDGEPIDWKPLYDAIYVSSDLSNDANFKAKVSTYFDLPVFLDYYLFIELMLASDNHGKNTYLYVYDQTVAPKLSIAPWDCDGTWGRRWDGSSYLTYAEQDFEDFLSKNEHGQNNLFRRLISLDYNNFGTSLKNRYETLRGTYFSYTSLMNRFQSYCDLFNLSGAGERESNRWGIEDINSEMSFVSSWITDRLNYMDNQYLGGPYVSHVGIGEVTRNRIAFSPNPVKDMLTITNLNVGETVQILSVQGSLLLQAEAKGGNLVIDMSGFAQGVYLIKAGKDISKVVKN